MFEALPGELSTLDAYFADPAHVVVSALIDETCFSRLVFDYEA